MAEFVQVMPQFMRLCDSYKHCDDCPICQAGFNCDCDHQGYSKTGAAEIEHIIMSWAAEHPEPTYPVWAEWFYKQFLIWCQTNYPGRAKDEKAWFDYLYDTHIPADIAQKLGIKPKEDT